MSAIEKAMRAHGGDNPPNLIHAYVTRPRPSYAQVTGRPDRERYSDPTGPVDFDQLVRDAAIVGVPVARWSDRFGRHLIYRSGRQVSE